MLPVLLIPDAPSLCTHPAKGWSPRLVCEWPSNMAGYLDIARETRNIFFFWGGGGGGWNM